MLKRKISTLIIIALFCLQFSYSVYASESFSGHVSRVIDGDSLQVTSKGKIIEIRLYGIDSPEYDQKCSKLARKYVKSLVNGKTVIVSPEYFDSYDRLVATVVIDGQSLNRDLVASGYAWVYPRYCKKKMCEIWKEEEQEARKKRVGVWKENTPVAPWKWRRGKQK